MKKSKTILILDEGDFKVLLSGLRKSLTGITIEYAARFETEEELIAVSRVKKVLINMKRIKADKKEKVKK